MLDIPILSYNILSDNLCTQEYFPRNKPVNLDPGIRQTRLLKELKTFVNGNYILTLQEVSRTQWQWLSLYLEHHGYIAHWHSRGLRLDGYMGVVISFPRKRYKILEVQYKFLEELTPRAKNKRFIYATLVMRIKVKGHKIRLWIATTHLPARPSMNKQRVRYLNDLAVYLEKCVKQTRSTGAILTGDFNSRPNSLLDKGSKWRNALAQTQHEFTISSWNIRQPLPVQSCVDWILVTLAIGTKNENSDRIQYKKSNTPKLLPNNQQSSDHLPVHVIVEIKLI